MRITDDQFLLAKIIEVFKLLAEKINFSIHGLK